MWLSGLCLFDTVLGYSGGSAKSSNHESTEKHEIGKGLFPSDFVFFVSFVVKSFFERPSIL